MTLNKNKVELVRNMYGISMKKCCGICQHRDFDDKDCRICALTGKRVRGCDVCDNWSMNEKLMMAGANRGSVVCREYQLTLMKVRAKELLAERRGKATEPMTLEQIQRQYEEEHGSRYVIK